MKSNFRLKSAARCAASVDVVLTGRRLNSEPTDDEEGTRALLMMTSSLFDFPALRLELDFPFEFDFFDVRLIV